MLDPNKIDPGEVIIAIVGMRSVVSRSVEKPTQAQLNAIADFPLKIQRLAKKLTAGTLPEKDELPPSKYDEILTDLTMPFDEAQIEKTLGKFPGDAESMMAAMTVASNGFALLAGVLPKSVYQSVSSTVNLAISDPQWWTFQETFALLNNPLLSFNDICTGEILPSQVTALREIFPTISKAIDVAINAATSEELAKVKSFELPVHVEFGVANWFRTPIDVAPYAASYNMADNKRNITPSPSTAQQTPESQSALSAAERAALKPVTGK